LGHLDSRYRVPRGRRRPDGACRACARVYVDFELHPVHQSSRRLARAELAFVSGAPLLDGLWELCLPTPPDPAPVLAELARVIRKGQTNIDFTLVWEHRQTRSVLKEGFATLGDALASLSTQVEGCVMELGESISSATAELTKAQQQARDRLDSAADRQIAIAEKQDKKLDNIQRGRYLPP